MRQIYDKDTRRRSFLKSLSVCGAKALRCIGLVFAAVLAVPAGILLALIWAVRKGAERLSSRFDL